MNILLIISLILFALITAYKTRWGIYLILVLIPTFLIRTQIWFVPTTFLELAIYILAIIWLIKFQESKKATSYLPAGDPPQEDNKLRDERSEEQITRGSEATELITTSYKRLIQLTKPFLLPAFLFIAAAVISTAISPDKSLSLGILKGWFFDPLLFTVILIDQVRSRQYLNRVIASLGLMLLWVSGYGIYEYLFNPKNLIEYLRLDSIFTSANYVTMLTVPITILLLGTLIYPPRKHPSTLLGAGKNTPRPSSLNSVPDKSGPAKTQKQFNNRTIEQLSEQLSQLSTFEKVLAPLLILATAISLITIYLTKSYSGWLGLAIGILVLLLLFPIKRKLKVTAIAVLLVLSTVFVYTQKSNPKLQALTDFTGRTAVHARLQIWQTSFAIIKDNPIFGIGLGNFKNVYPEYASKVLTSPLEPIVLKPHNLYLNLWLETGILGLISFLWLIIIFYKKSFNAYSLQLTAHSSQLTAYSLQLTAYDPLPLCLIASMTALLVQGLFDTPYFKNDLSLIFWLLIGLVIINKKFRTKNQFSIIKSCV